MRPLDGFIRWYKCALCFRAYWHDGPSVLGERDTQRKVGFTDRLHEVTPAQLMWASDL